jgi:diguanylate cyclase (GGDEF)-like protein
VNASTSAGASAAEIATAAGAADLFVFRRVAQARFAHVGGVGRGAGWAGIVEISSESEPLVAAALSSSAVMKDSQPESWRVLGPYYALAAAVVPVGEDVFVVFGTSDKSVELVPDSDLLELAWAASEKLIEVEPAKRLADEIEVLNAVRDLLQTPAVTFEEALQRLVEQATAALSCDLGIGYVPDPRAIGICDLREQHKLETGDMIGALELVAARGRFPICVQEATVDELPPPFRSADGILAYYLIEIRKPRAGTLLLLHTRAAAARGFTLLCQKLGAKLVESAEPLLATALLRDQLQDELETASAQARREPLTGVANRLAWDEALASAHPTLVSPVSIIKVDCRGLKQVNDTRGHHMGDLLLKQVAAILNANSRVEDLVARLGGDEFGILLLGADEQVARSVVERIESALVTSRQGARAEISLAIGAATTRGDDVEDMHRRADLAMLEGKRA